MKFYLCLLLVFTCSTSLAVLAPISIDEAQSLVENPPPAIQQSLLKAPADYSFVSPQGTSNVNYSGQVIRQVLLNDISLITSSFKRGQVKGHPDEVKMEINSLFRHSKTFELLPFQISATGADGVEKIIFEGEDYGSIDDSGKNIYEKMAGVDNNLRKSTLKGWKTTQIEGETLKLAFGGEILPTALVDLMIDVIAKNADEGQFFLFQNGSLGSQKIEEAHILESGVDLSQLMKKLITVALSFSQATGDYLSIDLGLGKGLNGDNIQLNPEVGYTNLEHHWDEAFGYFGAARNFNEYSDKQIADGVSIDAYNSEFIYNDDQFIYVQQNYVLDQPSIQKDNMISLGSEKNFSLAVYAAERDLDSQSGQEDFTGSIFGALLKGRHLINDRPDDYLKYVQAYAVVAGYEWERLLAANTIHYINELLTDFSTYGTSDYSFKDMAEHFGEMKGFALGFQFNPTSPMTENQFENLHTWMQDQPADPRQDTLKYQGQLILARNLLETVYKFDHSDVVGW